jgi:3-deoxy-manno-octulosonate cytidylyltransferase (CMP-KDO synthetase)
MIAWVAELAAKAVGTPHVYIATDDERIVRCVESFGYKSILTSADALTGTDRVAEAATDLPYEIVINVQGDEPLVNPEDIIECVRLKRQWPEFVFNGRTLIAGEENPANTNLPKMLINESNRLIYASRAAIPMSKDGGISGTYYKQVCIYGYNKDDLNMFKNFGRKSQIEAVEDIEILRFYELERSIMTFECSTGSLAVDVPSDVELVERALKKRI